MLDKIKATNRTKDKKTNNLSTCQLRTRQPYDSCQLKKDTSGGYCGGVPPLPIPNREVKPTCADGTAMQCGRVGSRLLFYQSVHLSNQMDAFFVYLLLLNSPDSTPCQIGQCGRVGSRLLLQSTLKIHFFRVLFSFISLMGLPQLIPQKV